MAAALATPDHENMPVWRRRDFNNLRVFSEEPNPDLENNVPEEIVPPAELNFRVGNTGAPLNPAAPPPQSAKTPVPSVPPNPKP